jgi:hypothetical protein
MCGVAVDDLGTVLHDGFCGLVFLEFSYFVGEFVRMRRNWICHVFGLRKGEVEGMSEGLLWFE